MGGGRVCWVQGARGSREGREAEAVAAAAAATAVAAAVAAVLSYLARFPGQDRGLGAPAAIRTAAGLAWVLGGEALPRLGRGRGWGSVEARQGLGGDRGRGCSLYDERRIFTAVGFK